MTVHAFVIRMSDVARCPKQSLAPSHYRDDGTCKCYPIRTITKEGHMEADYHEPALASPGFATDNRWSPGATGATIPAGVPVAYAARWIDQGWRNPADILPDRQGFAYNDPADRDRLIAALKLSMPHEVVAFEDPPKGVAYHLMDNPTVNGEPSALQVFVRRSGGYYYVDAWLPA